MAAPPSFLAVGDRSRDSSRPLRGFGFARREGMTRIAAMPPLFRRMPSARNTGYTLIEIIVALLLFTIGGLALVSSSALLGREMNANAVRERAARMAANRLEILRAQCRGAASGREMSEQIESEWSVELIDSARLSVLESVSYFTPEGRRSDLYRAVMSCPR